MPSMDWDDYLRHEATTYRQLAEKTANVFGKQELLDLAAVCEEVANSLEDRLTGGEGAEVPHTTLQAPRGSPRPPQVNRGPIGRATRPDGSPRRPRGAAQGNDGPGSGPANFFRLRFVIVGGVAGLVPRRAR